MILPIQQFEEVRQLIRRTHYQTLHFANVNLITLHWQIGHYLCDRIATDGWGKAVVLELSHYIAQKEPDIQGFSDKNLWRMKQFYEAYRAEPELQSLSQQVSWTHNLLIFSKTKSKEERLFYLHLVIDERLGKRDLERQINTGVFERTRLADSKLSPLVR